MSPASSSAGHSRRCAPQPKSSKRSALKSPNPVHYPEVDDDSEENSVAAAAPPPPVPTKRSALQCPNPVHHPEADDDSEDDSLDTATTCPGICRPAERSLGLAGMEKLQPMDALPGLAAPTTPIALRHAMVIGGCAPGAPAVIDSNADLAGQYKATMSTSPPAVSSNQALQPSPASPGINRAKFFGAHAAQNVVCNLDYCRASLGAKVGLTAVVTAVYPACQNPVRRYILLSDSTGSVGLTVWNTNVSKFGANTIGSIVRAEKVVFSSHNGKKTLTMTRESSITVVQDPKHALNTWWTESAQLPPVPLAAVQDVSENSIVSVAGILGLITSEVKNVGTEMKTLTSLFLADTSGNLTVRSWNHAPDQFAFSVEKPIMFRRVRITAFAGQKVGELLDGNGTITCTKFSGTAELERFWAE